MRKILAFLLLTLMCVGGWADNVGPFTFTGWRSNSYTRVGGTEGTAAYVCNAPIYMEQKGVEITNAGDLTISFQYTNGGKRLELYGVELIGSESSYTAFEHKFAGSNGPQTYTLSNVAAGTYTLRIWSSEYGDGNSYLLGGATNGNITYSGDAANGANLTITSWSKDNWKKSGAAVPTQVSSTIKEKGWRSYEKIHYHDDASLTFSEAKSYNIHFNYTAPDGGGNQRLNIMGVEVLDTENNLVAYDYHEGYTGMQFSNRDYRLSILSPGAYTVRILVRMEAYTETPNNVQCQGDITYSVIDGSAIADNYTNNIKPNLYDNGVLKIGAPAQSYLTALDDAIEDGNDLAIEAAYNAAMTTKNLNLPSGYYYMKNMDMTSGNNVAAAPYAYNDYNFNGNTSHKTLMTATTGANNTIWKVENNGATVSILNGDGKGINNGTAYTTLNFGNFKATQFVAWGAKGIYFTQGIHASNQSHLKINGVVALTGWAHDDSQGSAWEFIPVENPNIYNVVVTGADTYVTLNGTSGYAYNGGFFNAASITASDLTAQNITGYTSSIVVNESTKTITVNYTEAYAGNHPYLVFKCERGGIVANANGNLTTAAYDATADNQKFLLVNIEDKDYLYSPTLHKFVTSPASGKQFILVDYPHHAYTTTPATSPNGDYNTILKINNATMNNNNAGSMVNGWETQDPGNKFQINEVGGISDEEYDALVASVKAACDTKKATMATQNATYSTDLGNYSWPDKAATDEAVATANALDTEADDYYTSLFAEIRKFDIAYVPSLNIPQPGSFLVIQGTTGGKYMNGRTLSTNPTVMWYGEDKKLVTYSTGLGFVNTSYDATVNDEFNTQTFAEAQTQGTYFIISNATGVGQYMYENTNNVDRYSDAANDRKRWNVSYATSIPVTISDAGLATLYSPVALEIPANVKAYGSTEAADGVIKFEEITGIIPAKTGVIIEGEPNTYDFNITTGGTGSSTLVGTATTTATVANAYTLQKKNNVLGFYKYSGETLKGFKSYLTLGSGSNGFVIALPGDELTGINDAVESTEAGAYINLLGHKVSNPQKGQIYILNGKPIKY